MKKNMKILLIVCLVLGVALMALWGYVQGNAGAIADINARVYKQAQEQVEMARVLGQEPDPTLLEEVEEVELSGSENLLLSLNGYKSAFLVVGIDLLLIGVLGFAYPAIKKSRGGKKKVSSANNIVGILIALVVLCLDLQLAQPVFLTSSNLLNVLQQISTNFVIAIGMTFVIISGGIDLAVGSTLVAVGAITMTLIDAANGGWLGAIGLTGAPAYIVAILISVAAGIIFGGLNGLMVTAGKIPPFIATLGAMKILRSVTQQFMQSSSPKVPTGFQQIARVKVGGQMFMPILYWLLIALVLYIVSKKTVFGRHVFAVGSNEKTSRLSGINVNRVKLGVYALMGAVVAIAAVLQVSRIGAMDPANAGSGYELDSIAAVIVGGTSMSGGKGSVVGTVFGMLIIAVMNNLLNLLGVPPFLREAFKGAIIIAAVLLQRKSSDN